MPYRFQTPDGVAVTRRSTRLDYHGGIDFLIDALDARRGGYFSSGVEYPDRYTRWDFGFVDPPLEVVARGREIAFRALNRRGERLLEILAPAIVGDAAAGGMRRTRRALVLDIPPSETRFAEEERSRQPSVFSPLRRVIESFAGIEDGFLGFYGAFGYDLIFQFEPMPLRHERAGGADLHLYLPDRLYVLDRRLETATRHDFAFARDGVSTARAGRTPFAPIARNDTTDRARHAAVEVDQSAEDFAAGVEVDQSAEDFAAGVETARRRMVAGDVFEVVLSRTFEAPFGDPPSTLFRRFREVNPSPYEFFIQLGGEAIVGASPEMFVRVEGDRIESCPIAGTIRRGTGPMEDAEQVRSLLNSAKDEAELTMCTDVDRNDKARICEPGSVRLLGRRLIERYAGLFHTVDHVEGRLRPGYGGIDAFVSHMWAVTLTGAPKRKAVELVEALERAPRGWYGGAVGGLALNGGVNTGITIRTAVVANARARYRAGASLVYDSVGAEEARETEVKATAFFRAIEGSARPAGAVEARPERTAPAGLSVIMIDNEDSFVHCLADYVRQAGAEVATYRWGMEAAELVALEPDLVIHSPGPGRPADFGVPDLVRVLAACGVPQFGVCLGLQGIVEAFGGTLAVLPEPRHGKVWEVAHDRSALFAGLPTPLSVGAYHSLHAPEPDLPAELRVTARTPGGIVMALRHAALPIAAVQFHPESILSLSGGVGHVIVGNALAALCKTKADAAMSGTAA